MASAMALTVGDRFSRLVRSTTFDMSMIPKPSSSVSSRQPAGMELRDKGAIARPDRTAAMSPPLVRLT
ncbi:hypothetical protein [Sinorhizobium medicae]|uniref:hypothetical protein n=1 Tax=Sinorhizobium medicae TaxID=110321 RepID=UPI001F261631|nr:hypothetical protein [Sinorhizobium medicae]